MPRQSHPPWFDHLSNIWCSVQIMKLLSHRTTHVVDLQYPNTSQFSAFEVTLFNCIGYVASNDREYSWKRSWCVLCYYPTIRLDELRKISKNWVWGGDIPGRYSNSGHPEYKPGIELKRGGKCKGKVVPVLDEAPRHKGVFGEWRYSSTHSVTSTLDEGEWSASRPGHFTPMERTPFTHWIGDWVGPRVVLDAVVKRKITSSRRESNLITPIVQVRILISKNL
jgi:hypothetical protein